MEVDNKINIINEYMNIFINGGVADIERIKLGFINDPCTPLLLNILIHCIKHLELFNKEQLENINSFILSIKYGSRQSNR